MRRTGFGGYEPIRSRVPPGVSEAIQPAGSLEPDYGSSLVPRNRFASW